MCSLSLLAAVLPSSPLPAARLMQALDEDWRFLQKDAAGMAEQGVDDSHWRLVQLPHDWSIEGPFDREAPTRGPGAFLPSGVAWYRHALRLKASVWKGREIWLQFDGAMAESRVFVNGVEVGYRPNGYVGLAYEISRYLRWDARDVVAVRCDTSVQPASRWYTGAGLFRHARLIGLQPVNLGLGDAFVSTPQVSQEQALVRVEAAVATASGKLPPGLHLDMIVLDPQGRECGRRELAWPNLSEEKVAGNGVHAGEFASAAVSSPGAELAAGRSAQEATQRFVLEFPMEKPQLWGPGHAALYQVYLRLWVGADVVDEQQLRFGVRSIAFDAQRGFSLNGEGLRLLGVCLHHDGGAFGAAVPLGVWRDRLLRLRALGVNAVRTAHNPVDPGFLDLCDELGFLVMDEYFDAWTLPKLAGDYHRFFETWSERDLRETVRRDRNHPCIILHSAGNEIHDTRDHELAAGILRRLLAAYHEEDPTRPVTQALFRPNHAGDYVNGYADLLDVVGQNYREQELLDAHAEKPSRKVIGTENAHEPERWLAMRDHAFIAGQFLWTGVDYLGESRRWPAIGSDFGLLDRCGNPKPRAWQRASWWSREPVLKVFRRVGRGSVSVQDPGYETAAEFEQRAARLPDLWEDWTPVNPAPHTENLEVYSNADQVELFLNGKSLGSLPRPADERPRTWSVAYEPGELRAEGRFADGRRIEQSLPSYSKPSGLRLQVSGPGFGSVLSSSSTPVALSSDWDKPLRVDLEVVDAPGQRVALASDRIRFEVQGPARVVAVDNGDLISHESFQGMERSAFLGRVTLWLRARPGAKGPVVLRARAEGLAPAELSLRAGERLELDARQEGAKGDGVTLDTEAFSRALERLAAAGGGVLRIPRGRYLCHSLHLISHLTLSFEPGAVLVAAAPDPVTGKGFDEPEPNVWGDEKAYQDFGHSHFHNSLLWGENLEDLVLEGEGLLDGHNLVRGQQKKSGEGNKLLALKQCRRVRVSGLSFLRGGHFAILATGVDDLELSDLTIDTMRDGIDIDACHRVLIRHCVVNSPYDDAIVLKTSYALGERRSTEDVLVTDCTVSGYMFDSVLSRKPSSFPGTVPDGDRPTGRIKIGTETHGDLRRIHVMDCRFEDSRGLAIESVDGAIVEDVLAERLVMESVSSSPIFVRLGARLRGPEGTAVGAIRRVVIRDVKAHAIDGRFPVIVSGIPGHPVESLRLERVNLQYGPGPSLAEVAEQSERLVNPFFLRGTEPGLRGRRDPAAVPEQVAAYPEPSMFGLLPAWGLYARHVSLLELKDCQFSQSSPDDRPCKVTVDTTLIEPK